MDGRTSYIDWFPKPLLDDLVAGRWLPIVGAGVSRNAEIPDAPSKQMPLWDDLGRALAEEMPTYTYSGALDTISAYAHEYSRTKLVERLSDLLFLGQARPGRVHRAFCSIPFRIVCTTNFDLLLEQGYDDSLSYCRPVIDEDQLSIGDSAISSVGDGVARNRLTLLKLHGDLHHPQRLVVTEEDYDRFLDRYPLLATYLASLLIDRTAVLIGYSLDDPDLRKIWQVISERLGRLRRFAYSIMVDAARDKVARFERRGVKVINLPGDGIERGDVLARVFNELREYWTAKLPLISQATEEEQLGELSLPPGEMTRLCYFAISPSLYPIYREEVFPIAQRYGLIPLTRDDVLTPGETAGAKIPALMARAGAVLADATDADTPGEMYGILSTIRTKPAAVVFPEGWSLPQGSRSHLTHLVRPRDPYSEDLSNFLAALEAWFAAVAQELDPQLSAAPARLLERGEYDAAVIAAISTLEAALRRLVAQEHELSGRGLSMSTLLRRGLDEGYLQPNEFEEIRGWQHTRNLVAHARGSAREDEARRIVEGVMAINERLGKDGLGKRQGRRKGSSAR